MTRPRYVIPGQTVFISWRAVRRMFLFLPTKQVNRILRYCLAYACDKYGVQAHEFVWLSNHAHLVATFPKANRPAFMQLLNSLIARNINALRGTSGAVIEKHYNEVIPQDGPKVVGHCVYTLANPCSAHLVARARHWRGLTSVGMRYGEVVDVERPGLGIWKSNRTKCGRKKGSGRSTEIRPTTIGQDRSEMPHEVSFALVRPPVHLEMTDEELRTHILGKLTDRETQLNDQRNAIGKRVMGMRRVLEQPWTSTPGPVDHFSTEPRVSSSSKATRRTALAQLREFVARYRFALERWLSGDREAVFPAGTWLMHERFLVRRETAASVCYS